MLIKIFFCFIHLVIWGHLSAVSASAQDIRDVKPPLTYPLNIVLLVIFVFLFLLAIGIVWVVFKRRKREVPLPKTLLPWEKATARLKELEQQNLIARGQWDGYYSQLTDILRKYVEEQFSIKAPEMTTEEFLQHLQTSQDLDPQQKASLKSFLESSDLVKFAKYAPDPSEAKRSFELALQFVRETKPKEEQFA
ncbi:MAG TPA: DUF4381 family protein [Candidatus Omnitrophota bacterium]|nr:DUF4381 family protein [Candidatus Omnitrophota bacterium]